jgi:tyrosine-protein phosphatase YwqE
MSFFSKKNAFSGAALVTDVHAHWLPGIDDGAPTLEAAVQLVRDLFGLGFERLVATPHVHPAYYPNTPAIVAARLAEVRQALGPDGDRLLAAAEYYLDDYLLDATDLLTLPGGYLLFEQSFFGAYPRLADALYAWRLRGLKPVLAHPERYPYYHSTKGFDALETLWAQGLHLQVNLLALDGHYGAAVRKQAWRLLDAGMVGFLGTDAHHAKHSAALRGLRLKPLEHTFLNASLGAQGA